MHTLTCNRFGDRGGAAAGGGGEQKNRKVQLPSEQLKIVSTKIDKVESYKSRPISCNKVFNGIILGNGETICDIPHLKSLGVTHVLNVAEDHVQVSSTKYAVHGIQYHGFHVDDLPECDISRHFKCSTDFIHSAVTGRGLVVVNCFMGLSRSATCVLAYLMEKHNMTLNKALDVVRTSRAIRPNEGFMKQLAKLQLSLASRSCGGARRGRV